VNPPRKEPPGSIGKSQPAESRNASRTRGEGARSGGPSSRPPEDARRKRSAERRYVGWGDGIDRYYCARDDHRHPPAFPVESRGGVATIPPTVVARRPDALLLCTFTHAGPHRWPDGEEAGDISLEGGTEGT
jgi:hypothetical protein